MGRGHDADVHAYGPLAADSYHLAILHDAQQPHLRGWRQFADLVEEQGSAIGLLEPAFAARGGAGERALLVAEELRVDELGRDRAAVDAAEGAGAER